MHWPTTDRWATVKHLLRYLCGTSDHGLLLNCDWVSYVHAFSDAYWAGNKDDFTSTSAYTYIVYIDRNPISLSSKKQRTVARSSTETKYRSVAATTAELNWVCFLLTDFGVWIPQSPVIYCDNVGATNLCSNMVFHSYMKHLAIDFHFIRDQVQNGALCCSRIIWGSTSRCSHQTASAYSFSFSQDHDWTLRPVLIFRGHNRESWFEFQFIVISYLKIVFEFICTYLI